MASSFKGLNVFGSGPHRFAEGRRGVVTVSALFDTPPGSGTRPIGVAEVSVVVSGRLMASSEAGLWGLRDAIAGLIDHPQTPGVLVDHAGRSWSDMSLVRFSVGDRVDRGRMVSVAYVAKFVRFE